MTADRAGYAWAMFEFARTPYIGLVFIFAFAPYFAETVVGDPVRGQEIWTLANTVVGVCVGLFAPVIGAIADCSGGRQQETEEMQTTLHLLILVRSMITL